MRVAFPNRCLARTLSTGSHARTFQTCLVLLFFSAFASSTSAQTPTPTPPTTLTYDDGDLFLGFRATDRTKDYLINIGQPAQFVNAVPGSTFPVDVGSTMADLTVAFGADWFTRIDTGTGTNAVKWAITGGRVVAGGGDPPNILYSTNPLATPWMRHSDTAQSFTTSLIATMGNTFAGNLSTVNNPHGLIQNRTSTNSYASFQPGGVNSGGISFQTWNPWNEEVPPNGLFFNQITPGSGPSTALGLFTLNSSGQVSFTAAGGTPTPSPTATPIETPTPTVTATATPFTPTPSPTPTVSPTATGTPGPTPTSTPTPTPTPMITATATPSATPIPSPTPTASPVTTATPTPSLTPSPTPATPPSVLGNISTRLRVETGSNVLIGGFIVTGTQPKKVIVRAIGPSLPVADALQDPTLELRDSAGAIIRSDDNWRTGGQEEEIIATLIPPSNDLESAIVQTLPANGSSYTAIVAGAGDMTGVGLVEIYDLDQTVDSKLANISTRGLVQTDNDVMIAGTIVLGQASQRVLVRALGPSLSFSGTLADPILELRDGNGTVLRANDNWQSDQEQEIIATGAPPTNPLESALVETLPGNGAAYTAIVRGVNNLTGVALIEIYALDPP